MRKGELSHEIKDFHKSFNCFQLQVAVAVFLILQTLLWGNKLNWMKANILPWLQVGSDAEAACTVKMKN